MKNNEILALTLIKGIGPKAILNIIDYMKELDIHTIKAISIDNLLKYKNLSRYKKILNESIQWDVFEEYLLNADRLIRNIEKKSIHIISIKDERYPILLKMIDNPPIFLYCIGNISLLHSMKNVAVVGTRNNTAHGKLITEKSVEFLSSNGYTIVSGLALGIDTIAHQKAIENGDTISVLVDVDNIQPSSNRKLAQDILDNNGLLVAEERPGVSIIPSMFAKRDRIQSGLSLAVFPIETDINGGTMHAVNNALKEDRLVYTPDVEKSGYKDKLIPQLKGISYLINEEKAIPYTKTLYENIINALNKKEQKLSTLTTSIKDSLF